MVRVWCKCGVCGVYGMCAVYVVFVVYEVYLVCGLCGVCWLYRLAGVLCPCNILGHSGRVGQGSFDFLSG